MSKNILYCYRQLNDLKFTDFKKRRKKYFLSFKSIPESWTTSPWLFWQTHWTLWPGTSQTASGRVPQGHAHPPSRWKNHESLKDMERARVKRCTDSKGHSCKISVKGQGSWGQTCWLTWHSEVFERHGAQFGGKRTHPVGIGTADACRPGLHSRIDFSDTSFIQPVQV